MEFRGIYYFLSNFSPCKVEHQGIIYPSVEHFYVAMKCNNDQMIDGIFYTVGDFRENVAKLKEAAFAKKLGKRIRLRKDWNEKKFQFMEYGLREKFKDPDLKDRLVGTGNIEIIETNLWHDVEWGQCSCDKCKNKGKNLLGKLLMKLRSEFNGTQKKGLEQLFK
jgi:ribA/ribD-fused uncharacterized protein